MSSPKKPRSKRVICQRCNRAWVTAAPMSVISCPQCGRDHFNALVIDITEHERIAMPDGCIIWRGECERGRMFELYEHPNGSIKAGLR